MSGSRYELPETLGYRDLASGLSRLALPFDARSSLGSPIALDFRLNRSCDPAGAVALAAFGAHCYRTTKQQVGLIGWDPQGNLARLGMKPYFGYKDDYGQRRRDGADRFTQIVEVAVPNDRVRAIEDVVRVLGIDDDGASELVSYCLEELLRNVYEHADSPVNAMLQAQFYEGRNEAVFAIADTGMGILHSLRQRHPNLADHEDALRQAVRRRMSGRNIRRLSVENAGVGLTVTSNATVRVGGTFQIASGDTVLEVTSAGLVAHKLTNGTRWPGVIVVMSVPRSDTEDWGRILAEVLEET